MCRQGEYSHLRHGLRKGALFHCLNDSTNQTHVCHKILFIYLSIFIKDLRKTTLLLT